MNILTPTTTTTGTLTISKEHAFWLREQFKLSGKKALLNKFIELDGEEPEGMDHGVLLDLMIDGQVELIDRKWTVTSSGHNFLRGI